MPIVENSVEIVDFSTALHTKSSIFRLSMVENYVDKVEKSVS